MKATFHTGRPSAAAVQHLGLLTVGIRPDYEHKLQATTAAVTEDLQPLSLGWVGAPLEATGRPDRRSEQRGRGRPGSQSAETVCCRESAHSAQHRETQTDPDGDLQKLRNVSAGTCQALSSLIAKEIYGQPCLTADQEPQVNHRQSFGKLELVSVILTRFAPTEQTLLYTHLVVSVL
ncbi:hypothetical protein RRG08_056651 [Elysia crispata]|uniref:Uncharacterized protein n=1 Tax=Elysia crispata TaxID=231223 RepID=A0AAE0YGB1_9GAST|nr:hypothetical protein RRG08_056651 [Elysia crispata]